MLVNIFALPQTGSNQNSHKRGFVSTFQRALQGFTMTNKHRNRKIRNGPGYTKQFPEQILTFP